MPTRRVLRDHWAAVRNHGAALVAIGLACLLAPVFFTLTIALLVGVVLLLAGAIQASRAWRARRNQRVLVPGLWALLYVVVGAVMVARPGVGRETLTLILTLFLAAHGIFQLLVASEFEPKDRFGLASGVLSLVLALLIWLGWPSSADSVIGLLVGAGLVAKGAALIAFALTLHH